MYNDLNMNKLFILLAALAFWALPSASWAAGWGTLEFNQTSEIYEGFICQGVLCPTVGLGYMSGPGGTVYKTTDNGQTWSGATGRYSGGSYIGTDANLYGLAMYQNGVPIVVGDDGLIAWSEDGGLNWSIFPSPTTEDLHDVVHVDYRHTYAVGNDGVIIGSIGSYGAAWALLDSPTELKLNEITYTDSGRLIAVGLGVVVISDDLGETWEVVDSPTNTELIAVDATDDDNIFVVSVGGSAYKTTNGGGSWTTLDLPSGVMAWSIDFIDEDTGVISDSYLGHHTASDSIYMTTDGGEDWSALDVYGEEDNLMWMRDLHFVDEETLYGFGRGDYHFGDNYGGFYRYVFNDSALVKLPCDDTDTDVNAPCKAVYYVGTDGDRHAFANENTFFTWYDNFDSVITVDEDYLASLRLRDPVTYRPGVRMVKFPSADQVYAVAQGGVLREIMSEAVAEDLYGSNWSERIDDLSEAFFGHYSIGDVIDSSSDYDKDDEKDLATDIHEERGW